MEKRIAWLMPEQIGPAAKLYERMNQICQSQEPAKPDASNGGGVIYGKMPQKPQTSPEQLRIEMEQQMEAKKALLQQEGIDKPSPIALARERENPAATTDSSYEQISCATASRHPWVKPHHYAGENRREGIERLHDEIIDFHRWIIATPEEYQMRYDVVLRVESIIKKQFPQARVEVFGSFQTGLYLPTSDIDMVVFNQVDAVRTGALYQLQDTLIQQNIAEKMSIKVIDRAAVPIVKMRDLLTDIKVDISFNMESGVTSVSLIKEFIRQFPPLPYLVLLLKQFLLQRDMNEVWTGGISSYGLILMTVSFLQLHKRVEPANGAAVNVNLGVLLIEFFELYGRNFNYDKLCIRVKEGGMYIKKEEMAAAMKSETGVPKYYPNYLSIEDPLTPTNDIGRASHGAENVKSAFEYAYRVLQRAVSPQAQSYPSDCTQSILGRIIMITSEVYEYRKWVHRYWCERVPRLQVLMPIDEKINGDQVDEEEEEEVPETDEEVEKIDDDQEDTSTVPSPYGDTPVEHELPDFSSNDGDHPDTDNSGSVSDNSIEQNWREKQNKSNQRANNNGQHIIVSIANNRVNHQNIQRTIHQDRPGQVQTHRRQQQQQQQQPIRHHKQGSRDQRSDDHDFDLQHHRSDHHHNHHQHHQQQQQHHQRPHKSSQSDSNSTQEDRGFDHPSAPSSTTNSDYAKSSSQNAAMSAKSPQSGTSPTKRVNLSGRTFQSAFKAATRTQRPQIRNTERKEDKDEQQQQPSSQRRRDRRGGRGGEKDAFDDDRRSQRSRRSSDSRSSPIPEDLIDNRRGSNRRDQRYDQRYIDNASPNMMQQQGRYNRAGRGDGGHISPQGNYAPSSRGNGSSGSAAAMDQPGSYRMASDFDAYDGQGRHYDKQRRLRKSHDRQERQNYKHQRRSDGYNDEYTSSRPSRLSNDSLRSNPGAMPPSRNGPSRGGSQQQQHRGSRDSIMRDSFSPGP